MTEKLKGATFLIYTSKDNKKMIQLHMIRMVIKYLKTGLAFRSKDIAILTYHELNQNKWQRSQFQQGIRKTSTRKPAKQVKFIRNNTTHKNKRAQTWEEGLLNRLHMYILNWNMKHLLKSIRSCLIYLI